MTKNINEENIRVAAYYIWEQAGRPEGQEKECWIKACEQLFACKNKKAATRSSDCAKKTAVKTAAKPALKSVAKPAVKAKMSSNKANAASLNAGMNLKSGNLKAKKVFA